MKKLITLITILSLAVISPYAFANGGGEGDNTGCNGQGNPNSPCEGTTNNGGNGGSVRNSGNSSNRNTNVNMNRNKNKNINKANASNENSNSVNVGGSSYDNIYMAPPSTTPMVGTTSAQVTTPFGGAGFSKDAKYRIIKYKLDYLRWATKEGYITEEKRIEYGTKLFKKFLKANNPNLAIFVQF